MGPDMLASSLGMTEAVLVKVIQGSDEAEGYLAHISHRLKEAGIPSGWLNQTNPPINDRLVNDLRKLAGKSTNRAPIRRQNVQSLVDAFGGSLEELADVLELNESSVRGIIDGRLPVDDERCNHLNPRLMAGGFPDGWLDEPQAKVAPEWLAALKAAAAEALQQEEQEQEQAWLQAKAAAQARAAEEAASKAGMPAAPEPEPDATQPEDSPVGSSQSARPADAAEIPVNTAQQSLFGAAVDATPEAQAQAPGPTSPEQLPALAASQTSVATANKETPIMAKPQLPAFKPGNFAGAGVPPGATKLPRGVMSAGRAVGAPPAKGAAAAPTPAAKTSSPGKTVAVKGVARKNAAPAPASTPAAAPSAESKSDTATSTAPVDNTKISNRAGKSPISREQSLIRAEALHKLLEDARRGAKTKLWDDLLGSSLPYWGNIRRGTVMLRDEMANDITKHLGLPDGWLDNATFPPETIAPWVLDANVPMPAAEPGSETEGATKGTKKPNPRQPFARTSPPPAASVVTPSVAPPAAQPQMHRAAEPASAAAPAEAPAPARMEAPAPAPATLTISPQAHAQAEASVVAAAAGTGVFKWSPAANPQPIAAPGPLVQALNQVVTQLSLNGVFTDQHALQLITMLTTTR